MEIILWLCLDYCWISCILYRSQALLKYSWVDVSINISRRWQLSLLGVLSKSRIRINYLAWIIAYLYRSWFRNQKFWCTLYNYLCLNTGLLRNQAWFSFELVQTCTLNLSIYLVAKSIIWAWWRCINVFQSRLQAWIRLCLFSSSFYISNQFNAKGLLHRLGVLETNITIFVDCNSSILIILLSSYSLYAIFCYLTDLRI